VAIDVPLNVSKPTPGTDDTIEPPGASSDRNEVTLENQEIVPVFSVDPTLTADDTQPGAVMLDVYPLLPDATIVATPIARRLSMIGL
jgi:hypothetical protein